MALDFDKSIYNFFDSIQIHKNDILDFYFFIFFLGQQDVVGYFISMLGKGQRVPVLTQSQGHGNKHLHSTVNCVAVMVCHSLDVSNSFFTYIFNLHYWVYQSATPS